MILYLKGHWKLRGFFLKRSSVETGKKKFNQFPFRPRSLLAFFSLWGGYGVKRGCGEKAGIVFVKLFGFDSDLYLVVEGRVLCIKWKKPVVRG